MLNTPSSHRVHHVRNPEYLDANYGGVLIVFDRLFRTYVAESDDVPCDYGLVSPQNLLAQPLRHQLPGVDRPGEGPRRRPARPTRRWMYLFGPPGWRPNGAGLTTAELGASSLTPP